MSHDDTKEPISDLSEIAVEDKKEVVNDFNDETNEDEVETSVAAEEAEEVTQEEPDLSEKSLSVISYPTTTNVTINLSPFAKETGLKDSLRIALPSIRSIKEVRNRINELDVYYQDDVNYTLPEDILASSEVHNLSASLYFNDGIFDAALEDEETEWKQGGESEDGKLYRNSVPRTNLGAGNRQIAGNAALHLITRELGIGTTQNAIMWSAGISVTMIPAMVQQLHTIDTNLSILKRNTAWTTAGLSFSMSRSVMLCALLKELKPFISGSNFHTSDPNELYEAIDLTDAQALIALAGATIYPNGVPFDRACSNMAACGDVASARLLAERIVVVDNKKLTPEQRKRGAFSPTGKRKFTLEEVNTYKASHRYKGRDNLIKLGNITIKLCVPSIARFIEETDEWVESLKSTMADSLDSNITDRDRNRYLAESVMHTRCAQYSSWIESIEVVTPEGSTGIVESREDINKSIGFLQTDKELSEAFIKGIRKFIRSATISLVAIPTYTCAKCGHVNEESEETRSHPSLIALDAAELFFALVIRQKSASLKNQIQE